LVRAFAERSFQVMAEGRYNRPDQARQALEAGAWAVTVGTALTRLEVMTSWFCDALLEVS
jgi:N-acylglucosamine-6-phosphate 2-epimerase